MQNQCIRFNGDLEIAIFNAKTALVNFPASSNSFNGLLNNAPVVLDCNFINVSTFDAEITTKRKILTTFEIATTTAIGNAQATANKRVTITCIKGKLIKKVTAINPKCPKGYKKK
jgi:hypothetical protein